MACCPWGQKQGSRSPLLPMGHPLSLRGVRCSPLHTQWAHLHLSSLALAHRSAAAASACQHGMPHLDTAAYDGMSLLARRRYCILADMLLLAASDTVICQDLAPCKTSVSALAAHEHRYPCSHTHHSLALPSAIHLTCTAHILSASASTSASAATAAAAASAATAAAAVSAATAAAAPAAAASACTAATAVAAPPTAAGTSKHSWQHTQHSL